MLPIRVAGIIVREEKEPTNNGTVDGKGREKPQPPITFLAFLFRKNLFAKSLVILVVPVEGNMTRGEEEDNDDQTRRNVPMVWKKSEHVSVINTMVVVATSGGEPPTEAEYR